MFQPSPQFISSLVNEVENERLKTDFGSYFKKTFKTLDPSTDLLWNWHLGLYAEYAQALYLKQIKRIIFNTPFRSLKSLTWSIAFPSWVLGKRPSEKLMCVSYSDALSTDLSVKSRQLVESDWYGKTFPDLKILKDQNQKTRFDTDQNGYRLATSTGGSATGMGAGYLIADDYMSPTMAKSDTERQSALDKFDPVFSTRLNNQNNDVMIVVEHRLHEQDLTGMLLKRGGWEHVCLQGAFDKRKIFSFGDFKKEVQEGELFHPDRLSKEVLDKLKVSLGSQDYSAQIQQNPMAAGGNMVKSHWWWRFDLDIFKQITPDSKVVCLDSAYKADQLNDPSAMGCFHLKDEKFGLVDVVCERMEYPELKRRFIAFLDHHKPDWVLIEDKASGQSLIQELRRETGYAIIAIKPEGDKIMRLSNGTALIEAGRMGLPIKADWLYDYENELTKFPKAEHDDQVDMTSMFLIWFKNRSAQFEFFSVQL